MHIAELWRYPVKSMAGEELDSVEVTARGLTGDRAYALVDTATKKGVAGTLSPSSRASCAVRALRRA